MSVEVMANTFEFGDSIATTGAPAAPVSAPAVTQVTVTPPGPFALTAVANVSSNVTVYTGTITGGTSNAFTNLTLIVSGFGHSADNGTFLCVASNATTITLNNTGGVAETNTASAAFISSTTRTEWFKTTLVNALGESAPSPETAIILQANSVAVVTSPSDHGGGSSPEKPTNWNVYASSTGSGTETKQTPVALVTGTEPGYVVTWQEGSSGPVAGGGALPTAVAPNPSYTSGLSGLANIPPSTGGISVPQSPLNTPTTNTGRTTEAVGTYMATKLNILNVGTTPPPTGNLPH